MSGPGSHTKNLPSRPIVVLYIIPIHEKTIVITIQQQQPNEITLIELALPFSNIFLFFLQVLTTLL